MSRILLPTDWDDIPDRHDFEQRGGAHDPSDPILPTAPSGVDWAALRRARNQPKPAAASKPVRYEKPKSEPDYADLTCAACIQYGRPPITNALGTFTFCKRHDDTLPKRGGKCIHFVPLPEYRREGTWCPPDKPKGEPAE